jgi:hypothetical protein
MAIILDVRFSGPVMNEAPQVDVRAEVTRRFKQRAKEFLDDLEQAFEDTMPPEAGPAERVMLAHLMTSSDGYGYVQLVSAWSSLPKSGFQSSLVYLPDVGDGTCPTFAIRCRLEKEHRDLAILIDDRSPGERVPVKMMLEEDLRALNFKIILFSEQEVLSSPEQCHYRVLDMLERLNGELVANLGL